MNAQAAATHTGEERWSNCDEYMNEFVSSSCAIVGVFAGYSVGFGKASSPICTSHACQAEWEID
eukprot:6698630-Lingulodinium_polyedra.AAC.1